MVDDRNLECHIGMIGAVFVMTMVIGAAILSYFDMGYTPWGYTISELAYYRYKTLFSIGMVAAGALMIPFFIKLERELVNISERLRLAATGVSILTSICIAWVGIIPDMEYYDQFFLFHMVVAIIAFGGCSVYILMYSILMLKGAGTKGYKGPGFKRYMSYYGFFIFSLMPILMMIASVGLTGGVGSVIEWLLFLNIVAWNFLTAYFLSKYKFSGMAGVYYDESMYDEKLAHFEKSLEVMKNLNMEDDPIAETLRENIEFIKKQKEKASK